MGHWSGTTRGTQKRPAGATRPETGHDDDDSDPEGPMAEAVQGVIHGKTIELKADPGIADGVTVEVMIRPVAVSDHNARVAAIQRTAGALAHLPQDDWDALDAIVGGRQGAGRHRGVAG